MAEGFSSNANRFTFNTLIVGHVGSGQTSIINRYVHNVFQPNAPTVSMNSYSKTIHKFNSTIDLKLWDIPGRIDIPNVLALVPTFLPHVHGVYVVFDLGDMDEYRRVFQWAQAIRQHLAALTDGRPIPFILIQSKCDLHPMGARLEHLFRTAYCRQNGFLQLFNTSARLNFNITEAIEFLIPEMINRANQL